MAEQQSFKKGVKYIKLAKFDTGSTSENLTTPLGELKKIRVNYTDKGVVEYKVGSIKEYSDYYLYRVATTDATSSVDNKTFNYFFSASKTSSQGLSIGNAGVTGYNPDSELTFNNDRLGYFTPNSGLYLYGDTPNKNLEIQYTASFLGDIQPGQSTFFASASLDVRELNTITNQALIVTSSGFVATSTGLDAPVTVSGNVTNFRPTENSRYNLRVNFVSTSSDDGSAVVLKLETLQWKIITGSAYTTSSGVQLPLVIEPFLETKFQNGGCDVLLGNATEPRLSTLFFDADYSNSQLTASNFDQIISGSALRSQTPDSNYFISRSILPKYVGSKNTVTGATFTKLSPSSSMNIGFDNQLIQSTQSLSPINNFVSAIVEYESITTSGSNTQLQNERVPNNIIFIESAKPGQGIFQSSIQNKTNPLDEGETLELRNLPGIIDFSVVSKGDPSFFSTIRQIFRVGDKVNFLSYEAASIVASGSTPLVTRTVEGFSSSIETIVFEDQNPFPTALLPTGKGAMFSSFSSPVISNNVLEITKQLGNNN